jgi:aspartate racemase
MQQQKRVPGLVGISTTVDFAYQKEMQLAACRAAGSSGPINQLRSVTATLDFNQLIENLKAGRRGEAEAQVTAACTALQDAGADFILVTSGTTSTLTARARERVSIPFLDLGEAAWAEVATPGPVGLLATTYAAKGGIFHRDGTRIILPSEEMNRRVDDAIFGDLVCGQVTPNALAVLREAIEELTQRGAKAIILGNTDMTQAADELRAAARVPLVDAALAHARAAARRALA